MDNAEVDAGQFQPIAQMRRLAMVLPKALESIDPIPVKLCLPESLDPDLGFELLPDHMDLPSKHKNVSEQKDLRRITTEKDADEHEKQERVKKETERKEREKKESEMKITEKKQSEKKEYEKKEGEMKEKNKAEKKEYEKKEGEMKVKNKAEKNEYERKESELKEKEKNKAEKKEYEKKESETREYIPKNGRERVTLKEASGKQNYWSESETSSVRSIASQLSLRPGRNMRATPMSRTSSQNTYTNDLPLEVDPNESFPRRAKKVSSVEGNDRSFSYVKKRFREKDRDLVDQLAEGRKRENRREVQQYYVRSMINDMYRRKHSGNKYSSDVDHPSPNRGMPTEPRSQSNLSHRSIASGHVRDQPKYHHPHHRSKRSAAVSHQHPKHHGSGDASKKSAIRIRSLEGGQRISSAEPLTSVRGSDETENILRIIREEFKRLGFL